MPKSAQAKKTPAQTTPTALSSFTSQTQNQPPLNFTVPSVKPFLEPSYKHLEVATLLDSSKAQNEHMNKNLDHPTRSIFSVPPMTEPQSTTSQNIPKVTFSLPPLETSTSELTKPTFPSTQGSMLALPSSTGSVSPFVSFGQKPTTLSSSLITAAPSSFSTSTEKGSIEANPLDVASLSGEQKDLQVVPVIYDQEAAKDFMKDSSKVSIEPTLGGTVKSWLDMIPSQKPETQSKVSSSDLDLKKSSMPLSSLFSTTTETSAPFSLTPASASASSFSTTTKSSSLFPTSPQILTPSSTTTVLNKPSDDHSLQGVKEAKDASIHSESLSAKRTFPSDLTPSAKPFEPASGASGTPSSTSLQESSSVLPSSTALTSAASPSSIDSISTSTSHPFSSASSTTSINSTFLNTPATISPPTTSNLSAGTQTTPSSVQSMAAPSIFSTKEGSSQNLGSGFSINPPSQNSLSIFGSSGLPRQPNSIFPFTSDQSKPAEASLTGVAAAPFSFGTNLFPSTTSQSNSFSFSKQADAGKSPVGRTPATSMANANQPTTFTMNAMPFTQTTTPTTQQQFVFGTPAPANVTPTLFNFMNNNNQSNSMSSTGPQSGGTQLSPLSSPSSVTEGRFIIPAHKLKRRR